MIYDNLCGFQYTFRNLIDSLHQDISVINRLDITIKYDKQDQQGKAAFNERNPHMTQQQEPMARSPGGPQTKTGQGKPPFPRYYFLFSAHFLSRYLT
jgi:hypothetical protein